ncbi:ABC transporter ATP-binding protein [Paracoccus sp. P2]|jgi:branched-chain amino acid transport system ATP-binding protein|uniref:Amino acid/amide ABC transporter ATP-binding protein 1 (HAAT family) n=1 Tax=Paracoccus versutus TaxID=34007 RepID=A0A3D9XW49_PARVE|nr:MULTISPECIES: ABC transporter ATP-binding protein [Paracoccus]MDQ7777282.1 ABC transporter ATP-binding protein [Paracoccus aminovorans]REF73353.1 amino acid/amide ABC transporter ATP-binding protein 1 (HAAT family) [Paracoccus versutus]
MIILEVSELTKHFGGLKAVNGVNLRVQRGSIHSIIGPNGAGKTTLFNLITGSIRPMSGTVLFEGQDITGWPPERLARGGVARTFQRTSIFMDLPVLENVMLAIRSREGRSAALWQSHQHEDEDADEARGILASVGLRGREDAKAGMLAHGYQRALDIAIGLALKPRLILMDEPLAGMSRGDRETIASLITLLRDTMGLTIIVVEHDVGMIMRLSDRITVMQHGTVIADAPPEEIRGNEAVRQAYLHGSFAE